jgi:predicted DNA-binding transcriptional regulator YafY
LSPTIDPEVLSSIYEALLSDKQIRAHYHPLDQEPRDYTVNVLGLVIIDKIIYLVGTLWEYTDIKQFALHRFMNVEILKDNCIEVEAFDLQQYIKDGHFEYLADKDESTIELKIKASNWLVRQLDENPLSENQKIHMDSEDNIITATVKNTHQLRWWLMGLGEEVEVLEPLELREEFAQSFKNLYKRYQ